MSHLLHARQKHVRALAWHAHKVLFSTLRSRKTMTLLFGSSPDQRLNCLELPLSSSSREEPGLRLRSNVQAPGNALGLGQLRGWLGEPKWPGFEAVNILLPPEQMEALLDWSSTESIAQAELVAIDCAKLHEQVKKVNMCATLPAFGLWSAWFGPLAMSSSPSNSRVWRSLTAALLFAKNIRVELSSPRGETNSSAERFQRLCDQAGPCASPGRKATLRREISHLQAPQRWRLMDEQTVHFCALEEILAHSREAVGISKGPDQYELIASKSRTGYFHSFKVGGGSCPVELARTIATNSVKLSSGAVLHALLTPDGAIEGADDIEHWAFEALLQAEIIELCDSARKCDVSSVRRSL